MYSVNVLWFFTIGVSSFGNPRIEAYLQLPAAYRSLSRPSSAPDAKAFTLCSCSLELPSFALILRPVRFSFVLTWIAWVSYKTWIIVFFAAKRFFLLALFRFALLISQLTKLFLPFDWKDLISHSFKWDSSLSSLSVFSYSIFRFIRFSMSTNSRLSSV